MNKLSSKKAARKGDIPVKTLKNNISAYLTLIAVLNGVFPR